MRRCILANVKHDYGSKIIKSNKCVERGLNLDFSVLALVTFSDIAGGWNQLCIPGFTLSFLVYR